MPPDSKRPEAKPGEFRIRSAPPGAPPPLPPPPPPRPMEAEFEPLPEPKPEDKKGTAARPAEPGKGGTSLHDQYARVVDTIRQAEILVKLCADAEKDKIRVEYTQRYKNTGAFESDPEYQIRLRGVDREAERKKQEVQNILKLMQSTEPAMQQLASREMRAEAQEKALREHETRLRNTEKDVDRKEQEAVAVSERKRAEAEAAARQAELEAKQRIRKSELELEKKRSDAAALLQQNEVEAKQRIEAIAQTSREVDALQAKLAEELKHIDDVLRAAKQDLAEKLRLVLKEATSNLDHARRDIDELLQ